MSTSKAKSAAPKAAKAAAPPKAAAPKAAAPKVAKPAAAPKAAEPKAPKAAAAERVVLTAPFESHQDGSRVFNAGPHHLPSHLAAEARAKGLVASPEAE